MTDIPKPDGKVLRRNAEKECGLPVGQLTIKVDNLPGFQNVSFYCNQPRLHTDGCKFVGSELVITRRRKAIIINHP